MPELSAVGYKPVGTFFGGSTMSGGGAAAKSFDWGTADPSSFPASESWANRAKGSEGTTNTGYSVGTILGNIPSESSGYNKLGALSYGDIDRSSLERIMSDETGKYIGAKPPRAKLTDNISPMVQSGQVPSGQEVANSAAGSQPTPSVGQQFGKEAASQGAAAALSLLQTKKNYAQKALSEDLEYWKSEGKYWFDKEQDLEPSLEKYMAEMPRSTDALQEGTLTGGQAGTGVSSAMNPMGGLVEAIATKGGKDSKWKGIAEYTGNRSGEGAIAGLQSGGWIGAVAGAALGTVMGVIEWGAASKQDEKVAAEVRTKKKKELQEWTIAKNKRLVAQNNEALAAKEKKLSDFEAKQDAKQEKKNTAILSRRAAIINAFNNAGSISAKRKLDRTQRWRRGVR